MATIKFTSSTGSDSVSVGAQSYQANRKGVIEVPAEYEDTMYSFGFVRVDESRGGEAKPESTAGPEPSA